MLAVRPSDGLTVAWNEDEQYYAASLLKVPYALWLCRRAENGELDLEQPLGGWDGTAREALTAMIARSDNQATAALYTRWPADGESGLYCFSGRTGYSAGSQSPGAEPRDQNHRYPVGPRRDAGAESHGRLFCHRHPRWPKR